MCCPKSLFQLIHHEIVWLPCAQGRLKTVGREVWSAVGGRWGWGVQRVGAQAALLHPSAGESCRDEHCQEPGSGCGCGGSLGPCRSLRGDSAPWHRGALQPWPWSPTTVLSHSSRKLARPETCVSSGSLSKMPTTGKQQKPKLSFCISSQSLIIDYFRLPCFGCFGFSGWG